MPPRCDVREPWLYASNMRDCSAAGMPGPRSRTLNRTRSASPVTSRRISSGAFVNLIALPIKFDKIWPTRCRSHSSFPVAEHVVSSVRPAARVRSSNCVRVASQIAEAGSNIDSIAMGEDRAVFTMMHFVVEVANRQHLARVMRALRRLPEVQKLSRVKE